MIHVVKQKGGYSVKSVAENGELLATSETLKSKQSAFKNIWATMFLYDGGFSARAQYVFVQDDTVKNSIVYECFYKSKKKSDQQTKPRYVPGKNSKTKNHDNHQNLDHERSIGSNEGLQE